VVSPRCVRGEPWRCEPFELRECGCKATFIRLFIHAALASNRFGPHVFADNYGIPLEDFQIGVPGDDVPARGRRFLGVWETDNSTGRRTVLIVTKVDKAGAADSFVCFGPQRSDAHPSTRTPPNVMKMVGRISNDTVRFPTQVVGITNRR
jgi:hypothetical protein